MNVKGPEILDFPQHGNENMGFLSFVEDSGRIPFDIKRVYWIYDVPSEVTRGNHAHRYDEQVIICLVGKAVIEVINQNLTKSFFTLQHPSQGLYVPQLHWKNIKLTRGSCLVCVSSTLYDDNAYIKDFEKFTTQHL